MVRGCRVCQGQLLCKALIMILAIIGTEKDTSVLLVKKSDKVN